MTLPGGFLERGLDWLRQAAAERWPVEEAHRRLSALRNEPEGPEVQLAWEPEAWSEKLSYELLIALSDGSTVSLGLASEDGVPWGLRNAHAAPEGYVLRVNGRAMTVSRLMTSLDGVWGDGGLLNDLVDTLIVEGWTERWGLLSEAMGQPGDIRSRRAMARERVVAERFAEGWARHHAQLDQVRVARVGVESRATGEALLAAIQAGETTLLAAAEARFLADPSAAADPVFAAFRRRELSEGQERTLFGLPVGTTALVPSGTGWAVVAVLDRRAAEEDPSAPGLVEDLVFEAWLAEQREKAAITWYWGRWAPPGEEPEPRPEGATG